MNPTSTRAISTEQAPDWRDQADCRRLGTDPEWWFPKGTSSPDIAQADEAKAICRSCPVAMACATWALDQRPTHGVFGGLDVEQRRSLNRKVTKLHLTDEALANAIRATWEAEARGPLIDAYLNRTIQGSAGHVVWRGLKTSYTVAGRVFTPAQLAFEIGYERPPQGHVKATCDQPYCVAPEHLADGAMRWRRSRLAAAA
ncbi:WhiB family transcriptional regulator [Streptomyces zaomyceticus]|uniref:WhiB family transcriptional regulator n=1 Tax=Streptomyces zaomyceticus TaxID=68286 RepID=UPI00379EE4F9